ncbi:cytochrome P450 [Gordonia insulae]|uniref:Phenoxybenzoate dioxygenase subunit beta n=1 Tax=Gordonia insulae TaxID=2420509 RepID=A0A3G8JSJ9_9ACTN|nr:cytochrome P450 [Gordonia insulae]AZG47539.1 Phenoxybenzoate dioxygenase subunit beta [Gordonia insulae]
MTISIEKPFVENGYDPIYDPFTDEFQNDPFSVYARLRREAPVYYNEKWDFYALSRYDDVRTALRDHETYLSFEGVDIDDPEQEQSRYPGMLPNIDNPRHDQLRAAVQRSFMPRSIRALTEEVREVCDRLIDGFAYQSEVDISADYAWPIPFEVFYNFLGMPEGEIRDKFVEWTHGIKDRHPGTPELTEVARESSQQLREYLAFLLRERRNEPRDDVLTAIVQAEIDGQPLAPEEIDFAAEATGLAFALYLGGVETTAGTMSTLFEQLALAPDQQQALHDDPSLIPRAVEESLRFRTIFQVTARTTSRPVEVNGVHIPQGKRVFLILGSANLDETVFENAEKFDILRTPKPHLAFGEGLHGCLGNPLARLETTVALEQLVARKEIFELNGVPRRYVTTPNGYVLDRVPVSFNGFRTSTASSELAGRGATPEIDHESVIEATVINRVDAADDVVFITFAAQDGSPLPPWAPGAHIDVQLGPDLVRQYSLCGDPADRRSYTIGVLNAPASRGGSRYVHSSIHLGDTVVIRGPRNHFPLVDAQRYLFIAGGIGITPIAAMVRAAEARGKAWTLVYGGRTLESMALRKEFEAFGIDRVTLWPQDTHGIIDLPQVLGSPDTGTAVYTCGPEPLLTAVEEICNASWPSGACHVERFTPKVIDHSADSEFEIELASSGRVITVPADQSVLTSLADAGVHILSSCGEGTCGTCETPVVAGEIDHRDSILTAEEQARNDCMMVCVSRAKCPRLVLDV